MAKKKSKVLVIDASVARAAGTTEHPQSSSCRVFLQYVRTICHRITMNKELYNEWKKHQSNFSNTWRASMVAKRKLISNPNEKSQCSVPLENAQLAERDKNAIEKDIHLLNLALESDKCIASLDSNLLECLKKFSTSFSDIGEILWIDPHLNSEASIELIENNFKSKNLFKIKNSE